MTVLARNQRVGQVYPDFTDPGTAGLVSVAKETGYYYQTQVEALAASLGVLGMVFIIFM